MCQMSLHTEFQLPIVLCIPNLYTPPPPPPTEHKYLLGMSQNQSSVTTFLNFL